MCSCRYTLVTFECPSRRVLLSFSQGTPCPFPLFLPCFSAYAASLHRRIRMFVFLIGFAYLRKWFSCAYCSRCPLAAGYVGRLWRSSAAAVRITPAGMCRPPPCCHYVMTLCPLLAAGCFVIMSGIVCAVLFSGRAPYLFTRCILSSRSIRKLFFQGTFRACGSCFICARIARPPACWMLPCKEKYSRVLLFGTLNNCKSEFSTLYTSRNFHHKNDLISSNVHPSGILPHLSIVHRESPVQVTASHDTGQHPTALDAKRFHIVPIGGSDSHSSMLHPAASPPTFDPPCKMARLMV